jgi:adenylate cyclase
LRYEQGFKVADRGLADNLGSAVCGAAVGVYENGLPVGEILCDPGLNGPYDMPDGGCVIVTWDTDKDLGIPDIQEPVLDFLSQDYANVKGLSEIVEYYDVVMNSIAMLPYCQGFHARLGGNRASANRITGSQKKPSTRKSPASIYGGVSQNMPAPAKRQGLVTTILITFLVFAVIVIYYMQTPFLEGFEARTYDLRFRIMRGPIEPDSNIAIVAIDEKSIDELGRFPWSRDIYPALIDAVSKAGAKALVMDAFFSETESPETDSAFAASMERTDIVTLATAFKLAPDGSVIGITENIPPLDKAAKSIAHINISPDEDGVNRWTRLVIPYKDRLYPSLGLRGAMEALGVDKFEVGDFSVTIGDRTIPTTSDYKMLTNYRGPPGTYKIIPFVDIIKGRVEAGQMEGKVLFLGATTALGIYDMRVTPFHKNTPGVEINASIADNIIRGDFIERGGFQALLNMLSIIVLGFAVYIASFRFRPIIAFPIVIILTVGYIAYAYQMFLSGSWLSMVYPVISIMLTYSVSSYLRFVLIDRKARKIRSMFSSYVSKNIVDEMVKNPGAAKIGGDNKVITIMFSDVQGYTSYSEKHKPHEVLRVLNEYLDAMTRIIMDHEGTLDKFLGDGIMAYWGAPLTQDNHAELALKCTLAMTGELERLREKWNAEGTDPFSIRIGINSGEVTAGNIGAEGKKMEYTVIGDNVNLGARLEGTAKKYGVTILVSASTYDLARDGFVFREIDHIRVVGKQVPVKVYELLDRKDGRTKEDDLIEPIGRFEQALALYRQRRWDEAIEMFSVLNGENPSDQASRVYIDRCEIFKLRPPSEDWDGVFDRRGK